MRDCRTCRVGKNRETELHGMERKTRGKANGILTVVVQVSLTAYRMQALCSRKHIRVHDDRRRQMGNPRLCALIRETHDAQKRVSTRDKDKCSACDMSLCETDFIFSCMLYW